MSTSQDIPSDNEQKVVEIYKKDSLRTKKFGHNKYQDEIKTLKTTLDNLEDKLKQKTDEVELFKSNITCIQLESQQKSSLIVKLNDELRDIQNNLEALENNNKIITMNSTKTSSEVLLNLDKISSENENLKDTLQTLDQSYRSLSYKYSELKHRYQTTLAKFISKTQDCSIIEEKLKNLQDQCNLHQDTNQSLQVDIATLKNELESANNTISNLKSEMFEKNTALGNLNLKLNREIRPTENIKEEYAEVHNSSTSTSTSTSCREVKVTSGRGLKLSKR